MSNKRCLAVAELAVHLSRMSGVKSNAWVAADVASKLTTLEIRAQRFAERLCNEPVSDDAREKFNNSLQRQALALFVRLGVSTPIGIEIGGDPRGCCLKLHHSELPKNGFGQDAYCVGA